MYKHFAYALLSISCLISMLHYNQSQIFQCGHALVLIIIIIIKKKKKKIIETQLIPFLSQKYHLHRPQDPQSFSYYLKKLFLHNFYKNSEFKTHVKESQRKPNKHAT